MIGRVGSALASMVSAALLLTSCGLPSALTDSADGVVGRDVPADPGHYAAGLWAQRPRIQLSYDVAPDLSSATGRETGMFTPDARTCELVLRAWPNEPTMSSAGDALTVTDASVAGHPVLPVTEAAGAPDGAPPTLLHLPLASCLDAGQSVRFDLGFRVTLGANADERTGHSTKTNTAWLGTAFPLLSWVRGQGWAEDPAVDMNGESVVSEDFAVDLAVTAPSRFQVQGVGTATGTAAGPAPGTTTHRFSAPAVRDVTVGVGEYQMREDTIDGVRVHLATPTSGTKADPADWVAQLRHSITGLSRLFGPFPYADLWITITPGQGDGTEYPDALQFTDSKAKDLDALVAHEVSHQWFYALVGNNQAQNPWLDEALATLGEALVGGDGDYYRKLETPDRVVGEMGRPMTYWAKHGGFDRYTDGVYNQGATTLLAARKEVGADQFDVALRSYLVANAHRVATPADFARAFNGLPQVLDRLRTAGAIPAAE